LQLLFKNRYSVFSSMN